MTIWEYRSSTNMSNQELNEWGAAGWELVAVDGSYFYFKRPRAQTAA